VAGGCAHTSTSSTTCAHAAADALAGTHPRQADSAPPTPGNRRAGKRARHDRQRHACQAPQRTSARAACVSTVTAAIVSHSTGDRKEQPAEVVPATSSRRSSQHRARPCHARVPNLPRRSSQAARLSAPTDHARALNFPPTATRHTLRAGTLAQHLQRPARKSRRRNSTAASGPTEANAGTPPNRTTRLWSAASAICLGLGLQEPGPATRTDRRHRSRRKELPQLILDHPPGPPSHGA